MLADWTAACGPDDPVLIVPWSDPDSGAHFIDLRAEPLHVGEIFETELYPALARALRSLNAGTSAFLTAKCDVWTLYPEVAAEKLEQLRLELGLADEEAAFGMACYIDLLPRERRLFASSHVAVDMAARIARRAARLPHEEAQVEVVVRPALVDLTSPLEGYSLTTYITAVAGDPETASQRWEAALEDVVHLLREREWAVPPGSATID